jgi:long-chain fatty acid transport protein
MFWNSAAAAAAPGINVSSHTALVVPHTEIDATGGSLTNPLLGLDDDSGDIGDPTFVPATYANYQVNERLFLGLGLNGQYGFSTKPDNLDFAGTPIATTSEVFSLTINPNIAYKLTPELTVGVGLQALYADIRLRSSNEVGLPDDRGGTIDTVGRETEADDWGFGGTAGVIWQPRPGTRIGIGYRSQVELTGEGDCNGFGLSNLSANNVVGCGDGIDVEADLTLPDMVTASFSHQIGERWRVLGTVEWANWSTVPAEAKFTADDGTVVDVFPLDYDDGWFFSGGVEYAYTPDTILRAGLAYEESPIDDEIRSVSLPDNERVWLSAGFTTKLTESTKLDFGYSHLFVDDSPIETRNSQGDLLFEGEAEGDIDIVTIGLTHSFGGAEPELEPLK